MSLPPCTASIVIAYLLGNLATLLLIAFFMGANRHRDE